MNDTKLSRQKLTSEIISLGFDRVTSSFQKNRFVKNIETTTGDIENITGIKIIVTIAEDFWSDKTSWTVQDVKIETFAFNHLGNIEQSSARVNSKGADELARTLLLINELQ